MGGARGSAPPPPSRAVSGAQLAALPSLPRSCLRAELGSLHCGEEGRGARKPRGGLVASTLPPGRRGCTWPAPQPGCSRRPGLAGSAAAPGTCALAQTVCDHELYRPRLLLYAQLLRKCRPPGVRMPHRLLHSQPRPGPALEITISAHPP